MAIGMAEGGSPSFAPVRWLFQNGSATMFELYLTIMEQGMIQTDMWVNFVDPYSSSSGIS